MACCLGLGQLSLNINILNPAKCHWNWDQSADTPTLDQICSSAEPEDRTCMFSLRRPGPHVLFFSFPAKGPQTLNSCWLINTRLFSKDVLFHWKASAGCIALKGVGAFRRTEVLLVFLQGHLLGTEKPEPHVELSHHRTPLCKRNGCPSFGLTWSILWSYTTIRGRQSTSQPPPGTGLGMAGLWHVGQSVTVHSVPSAVCRGQAVMVRGVTAFVGAAITQLLLLKKAKKMINKRRI